MRWMALAYRAPLPAPARLDVALGSGPDSVPFPPEVLQREQEDLLALQDLGVRVLTLSDEDYPDRLRRQEDPPLLLHVAERGFSKPKSLIRRFRRKKSFVGWSGILDTPDTRDKSRENGYRA
ncbi:MAG: hypothetical protein ACE10D_10320 [Planctomycetota bacterium]